MFIGLIWCRCRDPKSALGRTFFAHVCTRVCFRTPEACGNFVTPCGGPYDGSMALQLTAVFRKVPEGYIGFVEELPGANRRVPRWKKLVKASRKR